MIQASFARKKKFRWLFQLTKFDGTYDVLQDEPFFVKLHHNIEDFINGKPSVDLSFIKDEEARKKLEKQVVHFSFISDKQHSFYQFVGEMMKLDEKPNEEKLLWTDWGAFLTLVDGCGFPLEKWVMKRIRPLSINLGELDYTSSEEVTIECIIVYDEVNYQALKMRETNPSVKKHIDESLREIHRLI